MFYKDFQVYGSPFDCHLKSSGTIQVKVTNKHDGWTVDASDFKVIQRSRHILDNDFSLFLGYSVFS